MAAIYCPPSLGSTKWNSTNGYQQKAVKSKCNEDEGKRKIETKIEMREKHQ